MSAFVINPNRRAKKEYWGKMTRLGNLSDGVSAYRVQFKDGVAHSRHFHPKHEEIVYVAQGSIEQKIKGLGKKILHVGDCAIIDRGVIHSAKPLETKTEVIVILSGEGHDYIALEEKKNSRRK